MAFFQVLFSKKAERDCAKLSAEEQLEIGQEIRLLETNPFPFKKRIKKIQGSRDPLYRLRADLRSQSYRVFYAIQKPNQVIVLRIVPKKDADRVLARLT